MGAKHRLEETLRERLWRECGAILAYLSVNTSYRRDLDRALPPYSMRVTVLGGTDRAVAEVISYERPVGIDTVGEYCAEAKWGGMTFTIQFDRILGVEL